MRFVYVFVRYRSERMERASGPPRACSSVGAARPWASSGCGLVRSTSTLTHSVRINHNRNHDRHTTPHDTNFLIPPPNRSLLCLYVLRTSFSRARFYLGPFWAWKVGPANDAAAEHTSVGGSRNASSGNIGREGRGAGGVGGEAP